MIIIGYFVSAKCPHDSGFPNRIDDIDDNVKPNKNLNSKLLALDQ